MSRLEEIATSIELALALKSGHPGISWDADDLTTIARALRENGTLARALRYGCGAAINSLPPGEAEWSPDSGIGVMLAALGCNAIKYDDDVKGVLDDVIA